MVFNQSKSKRQCSSRSVSSNGDDDHVVQRCRTFPAKPCGQYPVQQINDCSTRSAILRRVYKLQVSICLIIVMICLRIHGVRYIMLYANFPDSASYAQGWRKATTKWPFWIVGISMNQYRCTLHIYIQRSHRSAKTQQYCSKQSASSTDGIIS